MNCVSLVMLLFVRQIKMIYSLKLDNQAVDKKKTLKIIVLVEMLITLTYAYCVAIVWTYQ